MFKNQSILQTAKSRRSRDIAKQFDTFNQLDKIKIDGQWIGIDERIELRCWNSNVNVTQLTMRVRFMYLNGDIGFIDYFLPVTSNRLEANAKFNTGEGWILSVMVYEDPQISKRGQTFVVVDIYQIRDAFHSVHLISDYIYEPYHPTWPGSSLKGSIEGPGFMRAYTGTDPVAGSEIIETVPTNARWKLVAIFTALTTNATAGNRRVRFFYRDSVGTIAGFESATDQLASTTITYNVKNRNIVVISAGTIIYLDLGNEPILVQGGSIRSTTAGLLATDNWAAPGIAIEEWIDAQ